MPVASPHAKDPSLVALGEAIRRVRLMTGCSQEELAFRTDIERGYLSSIESGKQNPGFISLVRIASALGVTVAELVTEAQV